MFSEDFEAGFTLGMIQLSEWLLASHERAAKLFDQHDETDRKFWEGVEFGQEWIMQAHKELNDQIQARLAQHSRNAHLPAKVPNQKRRIRRLRLLHRRGHHRHD